MSVIHKPGCEALGGYGHGVGPCSCGAVSPGEPSLAALVEAKEAKRLQPCPFCEAQGRETKESDADYPSKCFMFIQCTRCGARTASIYGSGDPSEWADARHNWNARPLASLAAPGGQEPVAWTSLTEAGAVNFGPGWVFSPVRRDRADTPLFAGPIAGVKVPLTEEQAVRALDDCFIPDDERTSTTDELEKSRAFCVAVVRAVEAAHSIGATAPVSQEKTK